MTNRSAVRWLAVAGTGILAMLSAAPSAVADATGSSTVGGSVAPTLSLSVGTPPSLGVFAPGLAANYVSSTAATITSTAGSATLSISDPSTTATGHLVNGALALLSPLTATATDATNTTQAYLPVTGAASPQTILTLSGPVAGDQATIWFQQAISASEPLHTGTYSKTVTLTLSTTSP
jgi:hypothetical protein